MMKTRFARQLTAVFASVVATALCLSAAIGPAQPGATGAATAMAARVLA